MADSTAAPAANVGNAHTSGAAVMLNDVVVVFRLADGGVYTAIEHATLRVEA